MKAFVTGSTGLLGNNLVRALRADGHEVWALARSREKAAKLLAGTDAHIVIGDMEDVSGFADTLAGMDAVFHTAAYFRESFGLGDHWQPLQKINIDGTLALLEAAERRGVSRFIHTSSSGVFGGTFRDMARVVDETTPPDKGVHENLYFRSKLLADRAIAERLPSLKMDVVTIHPTVMLGPYDAAPTGIGRTIIGALNRQLPAVPPGGFSVIDVREVANTMIAAYQRGRRGEGYLVGGNFLTTSELVNTVNRIAGLPALPTLPAPVALGFAIMSELIASITRSEPMITRAALQTLRSNGPVTMAKAVRELGATVRPLEETLRDEVRWYMENGYVEAKQVAGLRAALARG